VRASGAITNTPQFEAHTLTPTPLPLHGRGVRIATDEGISHTLVLIHPYRPFPIEPVASASPAAAASAPL